MWFICSHICKKGKHKSTIRCEKETYPVAAVKVAPSKRMHFGFLNGELYSRRKKRVKWGIILEKQFWLSAVDYICSQKCAADNCRFTYKYPISLNRRKRSICAQVGAGILPLHTEKAQCAASDKESWIYVIWVKWKNEYLFVF